MNHIVMVIGSAVVCALTFVANAQTLGSRPVRMVVGFPPGGPADFTARLLAEKLPGLLGTNVIVDNRVGANATIAADHVAKSAPDGHTLFFTTCGAMAISPHIRGQAAVRSGARLRADRARGDGVQHFRGPSVATGS